MLMVAVRAGLGAMISVLAILFLLLQPAWAEPEVGAKAAILIDGTSGEVLWQKNAHEQLPPASTTKILTAITALDLASGTDNCLISGGAAAVGEASIGLRAGENWALDDLLQGALIRSGNDACYAIAENLAGAEPTYVEWLNWKARLLGAYDSTVKNTNGLPAEGHLMSAYDLALFARYAMHNSRFREIVASKYAVIGEDSRKRQIKSTNKLLWRRENIIGVKTGTTDEAGACLVAASNQNGLFLISVVLGSPDRYGESLELLDYGASNYLAVNICARDSLSGCLPIKGAQNQLLPFAAINDGYFLYPKSAKGLHLEWRLPKFVTAPVVKGQAVGRALLVDKDGKVWGRIDLQALVSVKSKKMGWRAIFNN